MRCALHWCQATPALPDDGAHRPGVERSLALDEGRQRLARDELEDEVGEVTVLAVVEDGGDVGVREVRRVERLAAEAPREDLLVGTRPEDLDGHPAVEDGVGPLPDVARATGGENSEVKKPGDNLRRLTISCALKGGEPRRSGRSPHCRVLASHGRPCSRARSWLPGFLLTIVCARRSGLRRAPLRAHLDSRMENLNELPRSICLSAEIPARDDRVQW